MQNQIIEFVIPMNDTRAFTRHIFANKIYNLVEIWVSAAKFLAGIYITDFGLLGFDAGKGVAVACVKVCFFAVGI
jgi:hypothetical protein